MAELHEIQRIVILGGGAAGTLLSSELSVLFSKNPNIELILVDSKEFSEYTPSIVNVLLQSNVNHVKKRLDDICLDLKSYCEDIKVQFIKGIVDKIEEQRVVLKDGNKVEFTHLIICTGSTYSEPYKMDLNIETKEERLKDLLQSRQQIEASSSILCIGGGPVGVEMASELALRYPTKHITLVHSKSELLNSLPGKLGKSASNAMKSRGNVDIVLDSKAEKKEDNNEDGQMTYKLDKTDRLLISDHTIMSIGIKPNSQFLKDSHPNMLDDGGFIKVDSYFQVLGYPQIYALGDVSSIDDPKLYFTAHMQAMHLARNLARHFKTLPPVPYKGSTSMAVVSLGPSKGVSTLLNGLVNITGLPIPKREGSYIAGAMKKMVEFVSLNQYLSPWLNKVLFFTQTKWLIS